jgi:NAD(P)-dependent dehydrogenase (short-subunit alcohol dehydrogenase family)
MPRENGFDNKRVVIVGGSSGIGFAVAEEAASHGANVVIVSINAERVQEAIKSIGGEAQGKRSTSRTKRPWKAFSRILL